MTDPRIKSLARVLLHYCLKLKPKQLVRLMVGVQALPLLKELYAEALAIGAYPISKISAEEIEEVFLRNASKDQLTFIPPMEWLEINKIDAYVGVRASANTRFLTSLDPGRMATVRKAQTKLMERFYQRAAKGELRWVATLYPTTAYAQDAGMSLQEYENFVYKACMLDKKDPISEWRKVSAYNGKLINYLKTKNVIRVVAPDTDLSFSVKGRKWINCDGSSNFPDGEVFTGPVEKSVNGCIRFSFPAIYGGREVEDVRLEFKDGKVVKSKAARGGDFLETMLNMDKGARYVGEVALGTNFGIDRFTRNILFDEKIGGTFHLAVGKGYPECGSKNTSALHWDMVCDLRRDGAIYADGRLFFKNGKFLK